MGYTAQVREFTMACNDDLPAHPQNMTPEGIAFIRQMVNDELDELIAAQTVTEQADALVDAIYYICDFAVRNGINLDPLVRYRSQCKHAKSRKRKSHSPRRRQNTQTRRMGRPRPQTHPRNDPPGA